MRTLVISKSESTAGAGDAIHVSVQADILSSVEELNTEGYNTQFTCYEIHSNNDNPIQGISDVSLMAGAEVRPDVYDWQAVRALVKDLDATLTVINNSPTDGQADKAVITLS